MNKINKTYQNMILNIMSLGDEIQGRNSITKRLNSLQATFTSTPLISIRSTAWKNAIREFEWMLSGSSNINDLHNNVKHWWEPWADDEGEITFNYGKQFRSFEGSSSEMDQIQYLIDNIKNNPYSRRNVITTWNTTEMTMAPIANCHGSLITATVDSKDKLHLTMVQRSADMILGVPHNWVQYWAFLLYLAHHCNKNIGSFHWYGVDCHIYKDHYQVANKIINTNSDIDSPKLIYTPTSKEFKADDFSLDSKYNSIIKDRIKMVV